MDKFLKDNGKWGPKMVTGFGLHLTAVTTKANGISTCNTGRANMFIHQVFMKANSKTFVNKEWESNHFQTEIILKESTRMESQTERENTNGKMEVIIWVNSSMESNKASENIMKTPIRTMKAHFAKTRSMVKA